MTIEDRGGRFLGLVRLSVAVTVATPLVMTLAIFLYAWLVPTVSGAGMDATQRPVGIILLACLGLTGWVIGTTFLFRFVGDTRRLPSPLRRIAEHEPPEPLVVQAMSWSLAQRLYTAIVLPVYGIVIVGVLVLVAPMLAGFLLQPGVYEPLEGLTVLVMVVACIWWSVILVQRLVPPSQIRTPGP